MKIFTLLMVFLVSNAIAEPYLAVREGLHCGSCHVNQTGGGLRNAFGNLYAQTQLSTVASSTKKSIGELSDFVQIGSDARFSFRETDLDSKDSAAGFETDRISLYVKANLNDRFILYFDQQIEPGGSLTREAWLKMELSDQWYIKAGKFFVPYGWQLEDDSAFVRSITGLNFTTPDSGIELAYQLQALNIAFAINNGAGGASDSDDDKRFSLRLSLTKPWWQLGVSGSKNTTDFGDQLVAGIFMGINTGPLSWLLEWDTIEEDEKISKKQNSDVFLLESNWLIAKGHNLKASYERYNADDSTNDQERYSLIWEYFPMAFAHLRLGYREVDHDEGAVALVADEYFVQFHGYF